VPTYDVDVAGKTYEVDAPDPNTAWAWANTHHKEAGEKRTAAVAADQQRVRDDFKKSEADRPWIERGMINLGAGVHSLGQGAQQIGKMVGLGNGVSDEELQDSRRMKAELAEGTTGGGALQIAGEVLPTLMIPGGLAMKGARRLPGALAARAAARPTALAIAEGAAMGGATGALLPTTSDESRAMNVGMGAAGGGAGTAAGAALMKALPRLTKAGRETAALRKAGKGINDEIVRAGESPAEVYANLRGPRPGQSPVTRDIPVTAAERSGSTALARAELAHRGMAPEVYMEHGRRQGEAIWEAAAQRAGAEGNDAALGAATRSRAQATDPMREEALRLAGRWSHTVEPLGQQVDDLMRASAPGSPQRSLANLTRRLVDENATPEQMYEFRKLLTNKLSGPMIPGDDVAAAVKGSQREVMRLVKAIDDRLDEAGDNTWSPYLMEYADRSKPVTSARAQQQITEQLGKGPLIGDSPQVTRTGLKRAVEKFGTNKQGFERLTPEAQGRYAELQGFLDRKEEPMRALKLAGTGGGGAQTAMQRSMIEGIGMKVAGAKVPGLSVVLQAVGDKLGETGRRELAALLADPSRTAAAIREALHADAPLRPAQRAFLAVAQAGGLSAGLGLSTTQ
jgi:hypothetical protein